VYRVLVGKLEGKKSQGTSRRRCKDVKNDLREMGLGGMGWINLGQDRDQWRALVNTVMNPRDTQNVRKFLSPWATGGFSRRTQLHVRSLVKR
jgi:hypothetical protein